MIGQTPEQELEPRHFEKVGSNWKYYDVIQIGPGWGSKATGWFESFTDMAKVDKLSLFNVRTGSKDGWAYTNMDSTDQIGRPFRLESLGMRFVYPDPFIGGQHTFDVNAAKFFQVTLPEHCYCEFWIRDDKWFTLKPHMLPPGYGPIGSQETSMNAPFASSLINSGDSNALNRWRWLDNGIKIPETAQIRFEITFSEYGKEKLQKLNEVYPLDVAGDPFNNVASIEVTIRGRRYSQMRGKYYK